MNPRTFLVMLLAGVLAGGAAHGLSGYLEQANPPLEALNGSGAGYDTTEQSAALEPAQLQ